MSIIAIAREEIRALEPYRSARSEAGQGGIMLNANESPYATVSGLPLNRYPDPQPVALVDALASLYAVEPAQVLVGRGSDEAIDLLLRAFCSAGRDAIVVCPPTFGMYAVGARIQGAELVEVPLDPLRGFALDRDAVIAAIERKRPKLVFLCSPNNPTGGLQDECDILAIVEAARGRAMVVVDEAYVEYSGVPSLSRHLGQNDNLAVLRTLSKAWGLAGARIGCLLAAPEVIALLRRILAPYPLPTPCVEAALAALAEREQVAARIEQTKRERVALRAALAALPGVRQVWPSAANFLSFRVEGAAEVYQRLLAAGIVVRDVGRYPGLEGCLRVSVGKPQENAAFVEVLAGILSDNEAAA
ncbi:MAG TPA: histidinol-phosphate transaminase [Xanthomonadaceae bacterium]|nr:histidinol-phosphate transaminase [Xanthomonadaceae bacterium]